MVVFMSYLLKQWNRTTTFFVLAFPWTEGTSFKLVCELFDYTGWETKSRLEILNSWPGDAWVNARLCNAPRDAPFPPPLGRILYAVI